MAPSLLNKVIALSSIFSLGLTYQIKASPPSIPPAAAIQKAEQVSTGNPGQCPGGTKFFPQPINHATFNGNWSDTKSVFLMQYEVNDTYYKPGGPILFYQGTETPTMACAEYTSIWDWAQELNALVVANEHRYFGISIPYGLNYTEAATWNPALMKPLTIDNALHDTISLISWLESEAYPAAKNAEVIMMSGTFYEYSKRKLQQDYLDNNQAGSYGGTLAMLYQTHYANVISASIAFSPVSRGIVSDPKDPMTYGFGDWVFSTTPLCLEKSRLIYCRPIWCITTTQPKHQTSSDKAC